MLQYTSYRYFRINYFKLNGGKMKVRDFSVPALLILTVLMFIIPLPPGLLSVFLAINLIIATVILLTTTNIKEPLQLSVFPTIIVITTLYRIALNVSTTRLILGTGNAGEVVRRFGEFVGGGDLVIGFVMFAIIVVVNFLVITKGAERVAEVAARFTLDAMPGKQMAIDADLNSGIINEQEARERRSKIQKEADFYGSMDGASKFVKNDAIAGIVITFINIAGGIITGIVVKGMELNTALETYTILTIGDGLVSQLPALMISAATSFIVTRAVSDDNISTELIKQLVNNYRLLYVTAGISVVLSLFLGFVPFIVIAIILIVIASIQRRQKIEGDKQEELEVEEEEVEEIRRPENVVSLLQVDPIELEFGYGIIPLADVNQGGDLLDRVVMIRRQLALELGMIVPIIRLRDNIQLSPNQYIIKIKGTEVSDGEIILDHYMAMNPGLVEEEIEGIETVEPAFGLPALWITEEQRDKAEMLGYTVVDPPSIIATHLTEVIKKFAHELMGRQEIQSIVDNVKQTHPALIDELIPKQMTLGELQKILANLLKEGVSIRDMVTVMETLADNILSTRDTDMLTEYVRQAMGRAISAKFFADTKSNVITLDPNLEQMIMDSVQKTENTSYLSIDPSTTNKIIENLSTIVQKIVKLGKQPIVLASPLVRLYFKRLTEGTIPDLIVLSYNELDLNTEIESVGMVSI
jgi:flagellar biosynthesis protein FlhA